MTVASAAGAFGHAYARETPSWAAQGAGQDVANLFVVTPVLLLTGFLAARGSLRALLVWTGLLLYVVYSYVLYAFYVHFNAMFLVYVATLGASFYALAGVVLSVDRGGIRSAFACETHTAAMGVVLIVIAALFALLWLSDVGVALLRGTAPTSVEEVGLPVNPVHVLDLAFALPGLITVGVLVRRRHPLGLFLAVPCATFLIVMGGAILAMAWMMSVRAVPGGGLPVPIVGTIIVMFYVTQRYVHDLANA